MWVYLPKKCVELIYSQVPGLEVSHSNISSPDMKRLAMSKTKSTARLYSYLESRMDSLMMRQFGVMYEPLTVSNGVEKWILSMGDSPVSHSLSLARTRAQKTKEICGLIPTESLAKYDHGTHCWKTPQIYLFTNTLDEFSGTWPKSGMIVNGILYQRDMLEPFIEGRGYGFLPTPTALEYKDKGTVKLLSRLDKGGRLARRLSSIGLKKQLLTADEVVFVNPLFVEQMMGWPPQWTDLKCLEMDGSFKSWLKLFKSQIGEWIDYDMPL